MEIITECSKAEEQTDILKSVLKESRLNFCLWETPFNVHFKVNKRFYKDFSPPQLQCDEKQKPHKVIPWWSLSHLSQY